MSNVLIDWSNFGRVINPVYSEIFKNTDCRYLVLMGGGGSGKSYTAADWVIRKSVLDRPTITAVIRKVHKTLKFSCIPLILERCEKLGIDKLVTYSKSDSKMIINLPDHKSEIWFLGLDDPEKIKSIQGVDRVWVEEASELTLDDFKQLNLRLRGSRRNKQIMMTFNPISRNLWLREEFFGDGFSEAGVPSKIDYGGSKAVRLITTIEHNKLLKDPVYVSMLESLKGTAHEIYRLAKWGVYEGIVYDWMTTDEYPSEFEFQIYGLDFGYTNPMALVELRFAEGIYFAKQLIYQTHLTTGDLIEKMKSLNINGKIYCDSAEPDRILDIKRAGFNAVKADKDIKNGVDFLLKSIVKVHKNSMNIIDEAASYVWNEKKDLPVDDNNHALDAIRYAVYTHSRRTPFYAF